MAAGNCDIAQAIVDTLQNGKVENDPNIGDHIAFENGTEKCVIDAKGESLCAFNKMEYNDDGTPKVTICGQENCHRGTLDEYAGSNNRENKSGGSGSADNPKEPGNNPGSGGSSGGNNGSSQSGNTGNNGGSQSGGVNAGNGNSGSGSGSSDNHSGGGDNGSGGQGSGDSGGGAGQGSGNGSGIGQGDGDGEDDKGGEGNVDYNAVLYSVF